MEPTCARTPHARRERDNGSVGSRPVGKSLYAKAADADKKVVDQVARLAAERGVSRAQIALAWLLSKTVITAPIVGATKMQHLDDALAAPSIKLTPSEVALLEEPYVPHEVVGHR